MVPIGTKVSSHVARVGTGTAKKEPGRQWWGTATRSDVVRWLPPTGIGSCNLANVEIRWPLDLRRCPSLGRLTDRPPRVGSADRLASPADLILAWIVAARRVAVARGDLRTIVF